MIEANLMSHDVISKPSDEIAIIGMTCRFPRAKTLAEFWQNLREGVECITFFSDEELLAAGIRQAVLDRPQYVKAHAIMDDIEYFDASFFGVSPREAEIMDPQHRLFLECAWEGLESAGYDPKRYDGPIGVYAGSYLSTYLWLNLYPNLDLIRMMGITSVRHANIQDYLATRVSYKLDLNGPSFTVQTACSTSLVAVHLACQGLLSGECDMALAGAVTIQLPQQSGHEYREGDILSPDGHCRAFDAKAQGTVFGNGVGIVVLKRLEDALADGDTIHATIKGSSINNDGAMKVGYTAPSIDGQAEVIAEALAVARVAPETISYVETHGTGTVLGDPIEITALNQVFGSGAGRLTRCPIGSVKTNVGHLNTAAGMAGLLKTVLALQHQLLPPSLHYEQPNPNIDFANSPFYVNTELAEWPAGSTPRRAGVSAFGIGGTNAHVVLEEAPAAAASGPSRAWQLLLLSAQTETALETATTNLATYGAQQTTVNLADVAYTLQVGRQVFSHRRMAVCQDWPDAIEALHTRRPPQVVTHVQEAQNRPVAFLFPGQGSQYVGMTRELYGSEPAFRAEVDRCADLLRPHLGLDIQQMLYPHDETHEAQQRLQQTDIAQPALFVVEYALAQLWMTWGIRPQALLGHSIGEYVAACLAGVFSLEDALALVAARGRLMQQLPPGDMLSVALSESEVQSRLGDSLSLAAINASGWCVVSGPAPAIAALYDGLAQSDVACQRLHTSHAFHSAMMEPIVTDFAEHVSRLRLQPPTQPYISNVSGTWITAEEATDPGYWGRHLRYPVRFADGVSVLLQEPQQVLLEVGPGRALSMLTRQHLQKGPAHVVAASLPSARSQQPDTAALLHALGELWLAGVEVDWTGFYHHERRHRIPLPTYPFERQRHWVEANRDGTAARPHDTGHTPEEPLRQLQNLDDWFYLPSWKQTLPPQPVPASSAANSLGGWMLLIDSWGLGEQLAQRLKDAGHEPVVVRIGPEFAALGEHVYTLDPRRGETYQTLFSQLRASGKTPRHIVHLWSLTAGPAEPPSPGAFGPRQELGYDSLVLLMQALDQAGMINPFEAHAPVRLSVVSNHLYTIVDAEEVQPEKTTLLGPCIVIPQEYPQVTCQCIDVGALTASASPTSAMIDQLLTEIGTFSPDPAIAYRGQQRWVPSFEAVQLKPEGVTARHLKPQGVYLITGGLDDLGLLVADLLARTVQAKLVLVAPAALPPHHDWDAWLESHPEADAMSHQIRQLQALESHGAEVITCQADVADAAQMQAVIAQTEARFGTLNGVFHTAAMRLETSLAQPAASLDPGALQSRFRLKIESLYALEQALRGRTLDFCLLFSSLASILGGLGLTAYTAAHRFIDAFAVQQSKAAGQMWSSINWDRLQRRDDARASVHMSLDQYVMTPAETVEVLRRVLATVNMGQVAVSAMDLHAKLARWLQPAPSPSPSSPSGEAAAPPHSRPDLLQDYVAPSDDLEQIIADIWQDLLGIDEVGVHDNFFELGGHSLLATRVVSQLRDTFQLDLPIRQFFEAPTVSETAELIAQELSEFIDTEQLEAIEQLAQDDLPLTGDPPRQGSGAHHE